MRKWVPYILSCIFLFLCSFLTISQLNALGTSIDEQESKISDLQNQITIKQASKEAVHTAVVTDSTGLDASRVAHDDNIAATFLKKCLTWSSYDEYMDVRKSLMDDYGLKPDSNFLKVFMPEVVNTTSPDGTNYNRIDVFGLNLSYDAMTSYVTDISDDKYSYFSFVTVSSQSKTKYEGTTTAAFIYTIDKDGNITNIDASGIS